MIEKRHLIYVAGVSVGAVIAYETACFIKRSIKDWRFPFVAIGTVGELHIYPLKSARGKSVNSLECGPLGASYGEMRDRHFLVIDAITNQFMVGKILTGLVLLNCEVMQNLLTLSAPNTLSIAVDLDKVLAERRLRTAEYKPGEHTDGYDCGDVVAEWLQLVLKSPGPLRLLYYVDGLHTDRTCTPQDAWMNSPVPRRSDDTAYANSSPYMAVAAASLDDLRTRLSDNEASQVSMANFRPNIVVIGCDAFDEDKWMELRIGRAQFTSVKPCTRCPSILVNPVTAVKSATMQPMRTLREYRLAPEGKMRNTFKDSPIFGVKMALDTPGTIRVGDVVYARRKARPF